MAELIPLWTDVPGTLKSEFSFCAEMAPGSRIIVYSLIKTGHTDEIPRLDGSEVSLSMQLTDTAQRRVLQVI